MAPPAISDLIHAPASQHTSPLPGHQVSVNHNFTSKTSTNANFSEKFAPLQNPAPPCFQHLHRLTPQYHSPEWCLPARTPSLTNVSTLRTTLSQARLYYSWPCPCQRVPRKEHGEVCTSQLKLVAFLVLPRGPLWRGSKPSSSLRCPHPFCVSCVLCGRNSSAQCSLTKGSYCALHTGMAPPIPGLTQGHSSYQGLTSYMRKQRFGKLRMSARVTCSGICTPKGYCLGLCSTLPG